MSNLPAKNPAPNDEGTSWKSILVVAAGIYAIVFLIVNNRQVKISFVFFNARTSLIFLVLVSMGLGAVMALFGPAWWRRRKRQQQAGPADGDPPSS